jgi:hypothetical protein
MLTHCMIVSLLAVGPALAQREIAEKKAVPIDPITGVLDAFRSHPIVALDEGNHGNNEGHAFRLALIRDPRFAATVNDIVVEAGNSRYQDVMDRFVHGEDIPYDVLRHVWQDTTQAHSGMDLPIYEEFYRAVRTLNATLPRERQLRILLGDPPIDWESIKSTEDLTKWMEHRPFDRDENPAELIRREVLAKSRRALVVYGGMHFQRKDLFRNYQPPPGSGPSPKGTIVELLETAAPGAVFTIWTNTFTELETAQADVPSWPKPSLAMLRGTSLGAKDFTFYYPYDVQVLDSKGTPLPKEKRRSLRMEDQFDAVLYLGPPSSITQSGLTPTLCRDRTYVEMRLSRIAVAGVPQMAEQFKKSCGAILSR